MTRRRDPAPRQAPQQGGAEQPSDSGQTENGQTDGGAGEGGQDTGQAEGNGQ